MGKVDRGVFLFLSHNAASSKDVTMSATFNAEFGFRFTSQSIPGSDNDHSLKTR
jgi:hypothetical protein